MASSVIQLMISRSLTGIFDGVLGALAMIGIGDVVAFNNRIKAVEKVMAGFSAAATLGIPLGLYFGTEICWETSFHFTAIVALVNLVLIQLKYTSINAHLFLKDKPSVMRSVLTIITNQNIMLSLLFMGFVILGQFTIIPFLIP